MRHACERAGEILPTTRQQPELLHRVHQKLVSSIFGHSAPLARETWGPVQGFANGTLRDPAAGCARPPSRLAERPDRASKHQLDSLPYAELRSASRSTQRALNTDQCCPGTEALASQAAATDWTPDTAQSNVQAISKLL